MEPKKIYLYISSENIEHALKYDVKQCPNLKEYYIYENNEHKELLVNLYKNPITMTDLLNELYPFNDGARWSYGN